MRILITGATGNIGKGMIPRLRDAGHDPVLTDVSLPPDGAPYSGLPFIQCDLAAGFGLERAARGCDLILHLAAWHGLHAQRRNEIDFWRLNVNGTFWMFQAAQSQGVRRVVFVSSEAWQYHYDKYGFTKRIGEELCEYNRVNHAIGYIAVRPYDLTPWGDDWLNGYGTRLLRGGVDREDVLDCVYASVEYLGSQRQPGAQVEGLVVNAVRAEAFDEAQIADWERDPPGVCERIFPGSRRLIEKYGLDVKAKPRRMELGPGAAKVGYSPRRHFGTFLAELARLDAAGGEARVRAQRCPY